MLCLTDLSIADVRNIVLSITAIAGIFIAWKGLSTWQKQLEGQKDLDIRKRYDELARKLLTDVFNIQLALIEIRMAASTFDPAYYGSDKHGRSLDYESLMNKLHTRWEKCDELMASSKTSIIEAQVVWGDGINPFALGFNGLVQSLRNLTQYQLQLLDKNVHDDQKEAIEKIVANEKYKFTYWGEMDDPFNRDLQACINQLESYLKPKILDTTI